MKLQFVKEHMVEGLQKAANIIPARSGTAYLRSLWLKAEDTTLSIMSTDTNIEFTGTYPAQVSQNGLVGVQGRAFVDLIKQLPQGEIQLSLDSTSKVLILEQGKRKYKLPTNDATWFKNFSEFPQENAVAWSGDFLQDVLEKVGFCISDDESMQAISCFYMKHIPDDTGTGCIEACGLNGHQFALFRFFNESLAALLPKEGMLVQKKYLQEIKKWLGNDAIEINLSDKRLFLRSIQGTEILSIPITENFQFPAYHTFMDTLKKEDVSVLEINRKESMDALSRISIFNTENERSTYFDFTETELILSAQGNDIGSANESLDVVYNGTISRILFPTRNLVDIMGHFASSTLKLILTGQEGPCGITGKDDTEYTVIIMPMKMTDTLHYNTNEDND